MKCALVPHETRRKINSFTKKFADVLLTRMKRKILPMVINSYCFSREEEKALNRGGALIRERAAYSIN